MTSDRRTALIAGLLYLATFVTSIPALGLKTVFFAGAASSVAAWGAVLELALAASCIGTAVVLYPVTRRVSEARALAFVASRTVEAGLILVGVLALMAVVTLRSGGAASAAEPALIALHDWSFLIGPAVMSAVNALLLGSVVFSGRLVPRIIPLVGLVGAPLLLASSVGVLFGAWTQTSTVGALAALPIAAWELAFGLWLTFRGFAQDAER